MPGAWRRFCVVGVGGHARSKLIPAIEANGQQLVGVVTRGNSDAVEAPAFSSLDQAVASLPPDTAFIIASPPCAHASQAVLVLEAGRDVLVEKPAFVRADEAEAAIAAAAGTGAVLVEGFMNRHTRTHRRFIEEWASDRPEAVQLTFTIPEAPAGTFRYDSAIGSSNLYDIGSYWLAALLDAGVPLDGVALESVDHAGQPGKERLHLGGDLGGVAAHATIGIDDGYVNKLTLVRADGERVAFEPFVYGRPGGRRIVHTASDGTETVEHVEDVNAFAAMFAVPRERWLADQPARLARMLELTRQLERLGRSLAAFRLAAA